MADDDGFVLVKRKKKRSNQNRNKLRSPLSGHSGSLDCGDSTEIDIARVIQRIKNIGEEKNIKSILTTLTGKVYAWIDCLEPAKVVSSARTRQSSGKSLPKYPSQVTDKDHRTLDIDIICYGLGLPTRCPAAKAQAAVLSGLRELQNSGSNCWCYDPKFEKSKPDCDILDSMGCKLLVENEESKRPVDKPTIFYMPHCGRPLYNNLLWANWFPEKLKNIFIIGNRFSTIIARHDSTFEKKDFIETYKYINKVSKIMTEFPIEVVKDSTEHAFGDTACCWFSSDDLSKQSTDFWERTVPVYPEDAEIIRAPSNS